MSNDDEMPELLDEFDDQLDYETFLGSRAEDDWGMARANKPWTGDLCPHCGSDNTDRADIICHDPTIWACQCGSCGQGFEIVIDGT